MGIKNLLSRTAKKKPKQPAADAAAADAPDKLAAGANGLAGFAAGADASGERAAEAAVPDALDECAALARFISASDEPEGDTAKMAIIDYKTGEPLPEHWPWFQKLTGGRTRSEGKESPRIHNDHPPGKDDIPAELRVSSYASDDGAIIYVAYAIFPAHPRDRCVLTLAHGATRSFLLNSPRAAEAIAGSEGREIGSLRFYHLWIEGGVSRAQPGSVRFYEVILARDDTDARRIFVDRNVRANCPGYVMEAFKGHVKGSRPQPDSESALNDF